MKQRKKNRTPNAPAACILCGIPLDRLVLRLGPWQYLQCRKCGLVALYPRPSMDELKRAYDTYLPTATTDIRDWKKMVAPVLESAAALLNQYGPAKKGRLLDVGCGYGFFLNKMAQKGWAVEGIEISRNGRDYARQNLACPIYAKPLEDMAFPSDCFDVVTLFYVIEHLYDPKAILQEVHRILKPGGVILLRWPHSTPVVKIMGPLATRFDVYHTPFHLHDFSPRAMKQLLLDCGFMDVQHIIGGATRPTNRFYRWSSVFFGGVAEGLYNISAGKCLLPGVSKTSIGLK